MAMTQPEKSIAKALISAQIASDAGKGNTELEANSNGQTKSARTLKYDGKTIFIERALKMIRSNNTMFNYYVTTGPDQNGHQSYITYFDFKTDEGERHQISFHTPMNKASAYLKSLDGTGRKTRWDGDVGGSRESCEILKKMCKQ